jgi:uncharacterized BrkB/YihY/UPF0761 family membrane protein
MEETFNDIWGVAQGRDWWPRITNYFFVIVFDQLLLITAIDSPAPHFQKTLNLLGLMPFFEPVISQLLPVAMISVTFALFLQTDAEHESALQRGVHGGLLAGTACTFSTSLVFALAPVP